MKNPYKSKKTPTGRMDEHRFLMQQALGRKLGRFEFVHHIDGDKRNNALSNLKVVTPKEHAVEHGQWKHPATKICVICGQEFTPHPTKRGTKVTCSKICRYKLVSIKNKESPRKSQRSS